MLEVLGARGAQGATDERTRAFTVERLQDHGDTRDGVLPVAGGDLAHLRRSKVEELRTDAWETLHQHLGRDGVQARERKTATFSNRGPRWNGSPLATVTTAQRS